MPRHPSVPTPQNQSVGTLSPSLAPAPHPSATEGYPARPFEVTIGGHPLTYPQQIHQPNPLHFTLLLPKTAVLGQGSST